MLLTQTAEYALRAMACLANHQGSGPMRSAELAQRANIPTHYVSKVMRRLVVAELILSKRGHGGGFSLARPPQEITFLQVLNATDHFIEAERCAFGLGSCDHTNPCPLHIAWTNLKTCMWTWASNTTLAGYSPNAPDAPAAIKSLLP